MLRLKISILFLCALIFLLNMCDGSSSEQKFSKSRKGKKLPLTPKKTNKVKIVPTAVPLAKKKTVKVQAPPNATKIAQMKKEERLKKIEAIAATTDSKEAEAVFKELGTTLPEDNHNLCNQRMSDHRELLCAWISTHKFELMVAVCVNHVIKKSSDPEEKILVVECQDRDDDGEKVLHRFLVFNTPKKDHFYKTDRLQAESVQTAWRVNSIAYHEFYADLYPEVDLDPEGIWNLPSSSRGRRNKNNM